MKHFLTLSLSDLFSCILAIFTLKIIYKTSGIGFAKTTMNILLLLKFINIALFLLILKVKKGGFMLYIVLGNTEDL